MVETAVLADGLEFDFSGRELFHNPQPFALAVCGEPVAIELIYDQPVEVREIVLVEGDGGGFTAVQIELLQNEEWIPATLNNDLSSTPNEQKSYELLKFVLADNETIIGQTIEGVGKIELLEIDSLKGQE